MNKLVEKQLQQVQIADLTNFNEETNTYLIPRKKSIKIELNKTYLVYLNDSFFYNTIIKDNWNNGWEPKDRYLKVEVNNIMSNMIKVVSIGYDILNKKDIQNFWSGWLSLNDIQVLQKL